MPEDFRIIGSGRHSPGTDDEFREQIHEALQEHGRASSTTLGRLRGAAQLRRLQRRRRRRTWPRRSPTPSRRSTPRASGSSTSRSRPERCRTWCGCSARPGSPRTARWWSRSRSATTWPARASSTRPCTRCSTRSRSTGSTTSWARRRPRTSSPLRFANGMFEPIWNRDHISYVQIDVPEELDIQGRAGLLRGDRRVPGHGRHPPDADPRDRRARAAVARSTPRRCTSSAPSCSTRSARWTPTASCSASTTATEIEDDVADDSEVETFAALEVWVDTWRWSGVPFYLRTGKAMARGTPDGDDRLHRGAPADLPQPGSRPRRCAPASWCSSSPTTPRCGSRCRPRSRARSIDLGRAALHARHRRRVRRRRRARGLRAAAARRDAARAAAVHPLRADRAPLGGVRAGDRGPPEPRPYAPGSWGPRGGRSTLPAPPGWRLPDGDGEHSLSRAVPRPTCAPTARRRALGWPVRRPAWWRSPRSRGRSPRPGPVRWRSTRGVRAPSCGESHPQLHQRPDRPRDLAPDVGRDHAGVQRVRGDAGAGRAAGSAPGRAGRWPAWRRRTRRNPVRGDGRPAHRLPVDPGDPVVGLAGDVDDPGGSALPQAIQQQAGQQERPDMIGAERQLEAAGGQPSLPGQPGVVDQPVQWLARWPGKLSSARRAPSRRSPRSSARDRSRSLPVAAAISADRRLGLGLRSGRRGTAPRPGRRAPRRWPGRSRCWHR